MRSRTNLESMWLSIYMGTVILCSLLLLIVPAKAEDKYWIGGSGWWHEDSNWNPYGSPNSCDTAYLIQNDENNRTVLYDTNSDYVSFLIDATGSGTMTLNHLSGYRMFSEGQSYIGYYGTGTYNMTGGWLALPDSFIYLGYEATGEGTLNLISGSVGGSEYDLYVGVSGKGTVNQEGGTHYIGWLLKIGVNPTGEGTYNLNNGELEATNWGGGPEIIGGLGKGTFNQRGGDHLIVTERGGDGIVIGSKGTYNMIGGTLKVTKGSNSFDNPRIINNNLFNYSGGEVFADIVNNSITSLSGDGIRTINGNIVNNGIFKTTHTTAVYNGTFTNNGAYISDPATQYFNDLIIGENGYLVGQYADKFFIGGDFVNHSTMNTDWNTMHAYLSFIEGMDNMHDFYLTGFDFGAKMPGYANNFSWGILDVTGDILSLYDGNSDYGAALYLQEILGLDISGNLITNISGMDGLNIYYMANLKDNQYLGGLVYGLSGGGYLIPIKGVPEPSTMFLLGSGLVVLAWFRKKFKK